MHVTVCICTRDRGGSITSTLRSIAESSFEDFDVVIVDQSSDDVTEQAVRRTVESDTRFTYLRSSTRGLSTARNVALRNAQGTIIAFTDDDCEVSKTWLELFDIYFRDYPDVGQICGAVLSGPHDSRLGFIPDYPISALRRISSPWQKWRAGGILANMAFRAEVLRAVGPFDEVLSSGSPLYSYEDGDMTYRVLKAGYTVLDAPDAYVIHHGFRTWKEGQVLMRRVGVAIGAGCMKHVRLRDPAILPTVLYEWGRCISWKRLLLLRRHSGVARFLAYGLGLGMSFRYVIDPTWRIYQLPGDTTKATSSGAMEVGRDLEARSATAGKAK
jgi:glycosyltransferase involved in cell wall biosynthesis